MQQSSLHAIAANEVRKVSLWERELAKLSTKALAQEKNSVAVRHSCQ